ncbi:transketolase [Luteibacter sp. Sphag1AF]|uniref:transketolase n=1 Tax=Luteibacter sp. Sphag1AF TaxID=2587031 RepID=UPI00160EAD03|nr:transketolase [Luteibacter sp. Sphag1AF]MBB3225896.1 transketolase [Luteibacter sp. Sphag1AF]
MTTRRERANAIRALAMDGVEAANSGHPGMPMGMADIAEVLWGDFLQHNPANPHWFNRDRFILSNGHGSMLQYALLHLTGYDLPIQELKNFRQLGSKTAGHPEYHHTPGVETTTGPLGQGLANAVGFAIAERVLADRFNREGHQIVGHHTYVFVGDGCLMEGISHEAASLAGTLKLGKLVVVYDDNGISIDGEVHDWFTDNTAERFKAYGWNVVQGADGRPVDGHDGEAIKKALSQATSQDDKPSLIICKTIIGFGSPNKEGKESSHGSALGKDEVAAARVALGWNYGPFEIPQSMYDSWNAKETGAKLEAEWNARFDAYAKAFPELAAELKRRYEGELPADWNDVANAYVRKLQVEGPEVASRKASQMTLDAFGPHLPELIGGSADLAPSNLTIWKGSKSVGVRAGDANYIHYGVREFGMSAISNGIALHGGFVPYDATFLVFSDYARNAVRMSALIPAHAIHVYTHDSIGLGEDGPTHQPVEHLGSLRLIPNNRVWRPCDAVESAVSWKKAIERKGNPSCLIFSRQNLKHQQRSDQQLADIEKGGYVLFEPSEKFKAIVIATGSEVELAMEAAQTLGQQGIPVRVVSMPCTEEFDAQPVEYREGVLPGWCRARVAVEAASVDYWAKYVGLDGSTVGMTTFGASAPANKLYQHFGITTVAVVEALKRAIG